MASAGDIRPTPNLEIYQFENLIESACAAATSNAFASLQIVTQQSSESLITPRVEWKFIIGAQEQREYVVPSSGTAPLNYENSWRYQNLWNASLVAKICTNRQKDKALQAHNNIRAVVRWLMQDFDKQVNTLLRLHEFFSCRESGSVPSFESQTGEDTSAIAFNIMLNVRNSAWPRPA